jgi:hypothetical protein
MSDIWKILDPIQFEAMCEMSEEKYLKILKEIDKELAKGTDITEVINAYIGEVV